MIRVEAWRRLHLLIPSLKVYNIVDGTVSVPHNQHLGSSNWNHSPVFFTSAALT